MKFKLRYLALGLLGIGSLFVGGYVNATNLTVTANMAYETAITLTQTATLTLGQVVAPDASGNTYTISTAGVVTTSGGVLIGGTQTAGAVAITGDTATTIAISAAPASASDGVTITAITCAYSGGSETTCTGSGLTAQTAPGAGKTVLIGVTLTSAGTATANSVATPTLTLTVVYG